ncbi:F-box protein CPR1-like [Papaver somniferum]|uniref:F-box protein CPR1-like n=1 Tax=Papaver somniferum TaxID=3469 RepID=UPI000E705B33|nr:F-box protein CPR1-like [Papaver somniferum]
MSSIPEDIFHDILLRLPTKSLLVCKCVCKNWFELISNPSFIHTHLNLVTQRNNFSVTINLYGKTRFTYAVHSIGYESLLYSSESDQDDADDMLFKGGYIFSSTPRTFLDLLCSCNGLVCLDFWTNDNRGKKKDKRRICIWNPATREYKKLPKAPTNRTSRGFVDFLGCALGYDYKINDYKFVTLVELDHRTYQILVYTLGSNLWKKIQNISCTRIEQQSGVLSNGAFHWLGTRNEDRCSSFVISFNISNNRSDEIQLPKEALDEGCCVSIGVLEECLCAVVHYLIDEKRVRRGQVILWVMLEYGVRESWTKRYVIDHERILKNCYNLRLMWYFKNGEILFALSCDEINLVIYDPKHGSVREPNLHGLRITDGASYFETLVSLKSGMYFAGNELMELSIEDEGDEEESDQFKKKNKLRNASVTEAKKRKRRVSHQYLL